MLLLLLLLFSEEILSSDLTYSFLLPLILPWFFIDLKKFISAAKAFG
jgi:hypothetical protein